MKNVQIDAGVLELIIHGIFPNATTPALGRVHDLIHDLAIDWDAFGIWFSSHVQEENLSLQEIDIVGKAYQFIAHDLTIYMKDKYEEEVPLLQISFDAEDSYFTNWHDLLDWISELKHRNFEAWGDGIIQSMISFDNQKI
jgi:hypothetical protein